MPTNVDTAKHTNYAMQGRQDLKAQCPRTQTAKHANYAMQGHQD